MLGGRFVLVNWTELWAASQTFSATPIYLLQGKGLVTPYLHQWVDAQGVVTGVSDTGFYLQDPVGDQDPATSDGLFVYTRTRPAVEPGQCVQVQRAYVDEFYEKTELSRAKAVHSSNDCPTTHVAPVLLPTARLGTPPATLFEPYEGMLVRVENLGGLIQGPTERFSNQNVEIALLPAALAPYVAAQRVFQAHSQDTTALLILGSTLGAQLPEVTWGAQVTVGAPEGENRVATGVLDYEFGQYHLNLLPGQTVAATAATPVLSPEQGVPATPNDFTVCTFNLYGLGRGREQFPEESAYRVQVHKRALAISQSLQGCTIIGLQELGAPADAQNLASALHEAFHLDYTATALASPQTSNPDFPLTVGLLTRTDRVQVQSAVTRQACSDVDYQVNLIPGTCAAGQFALFDRLPLVARLVVTGEWGAPFPVQVIVNHWKSKGGDETINVVRRERQAKFVATLVQEQLSRDPADHVIVLGDLNDYYGSPPIETLRTGVQPPLVHPYDFLPPLDRYTYIYNGASQVLDHMLLTPNLLPMLASIDPIHMNADFPVPAKVDPTTVQRASDHDPVQLRLRPAGVALVGGNLQYAAIHVQTVAQTETVTVTTHTDALGDFRVWNLLPGTYTLHFSSPPHVLLDPAEIDLSLGTGYNSLNHIAVRHRSVELAAALALVSAELVKVGPTP